MIAAIKPAGSNTRGLLAYLYGPGRHDEHIDPHVVAGFAMLGPSDPGRDENATLTELARHLDEPVHLRNSEFGKKVTDHVWNCPVRAAPEDRYLSDAEWGEIAQRIVQAAGIAPLGDDLGCRWIAVRHPARVLITRIQHTGRNPAPNRRAEAARRRSTLAGSVPVHQTRNGQLPAVTTSPTEQQYRQRR